MSYGSHVDVPMYARFQDGKLVAIVVLDPNPKSTQRIDITHALIELLDQRQRGDVPVTTQDG